MESNIKENLDNILGSLKQYPLPIKIEVLNEIHRELHKISPFNEPIDLLQWVPSDQVEANDYNPNLVPPPEMRLLELSIREDGYTQPIVVYHDSENERYIVVDGFHRNRIGKEITDIRERIHGFLPVTIIDKTLAERISSTIRHNRARGTHGIAPMSRVVEELYFLGWSDKKIREQLGMEKDELLRLKQFTGLGILFKDHEYSLTRE